MREKPGFPAHSRALKEVCQEAGMRGWGGRFRLDMAHSDRMLLPVREQRQNPISLQFISLSKHSNFENRTESAESRAPEINGQFGEE